MLTTADLPSNMQLPAPTLTPLPRCPKCGSKAATSTPAPEAQPA